MSYENTLMAGYRMQRAKMATIVFVFFALLLIASLLFLLYTYSSPVEIVTATEAYGYLHQETYPCTAVLKENTIYGNQTTIDLVGNASVYRRVTDHIDVNFSYVFQGNMTANIAIGYTLRETLVTSNWEKLLYETPLNTVNLTGTALGFTINNIPSIYPDQIQALIGQVSQETGVIASQYGLNITADISVLAATQDPFNATNTLEVDETRTTTLNMEFRTNSIDGDIIVLEGFNSNEANAIVSEQKTTQSWVLDQRNAAYVLSAISAVGLGTSGWFFLKTRPSKPKEPIKSDRILQDFISPYEEIIVEAAPEAIEQQKASKTTATIPVETLEDLVKIADILDKPIIHTAKADETHIFYALDGPTQYEFTTTISKIASRKAVAEEEENE